MTTSTPKISYSTIEKWFNDHYTELCQRALRLVKQQDIAEDIVQNAFYNVWHKRHKLPYPEAPIALLKAMVFNESIDWLRKNKHLLTTNEEPNVPIAPLEVELQQPEELNAVRNKLLEVIDTLPPKCHTIFVLSRFENLTYDEIAKHLGISVKTVEGQLNKAFKHIRSNFPKEMLPILIFYTDWL